MASVKELRTARGWSQQSLANRAGVSFRTIYNIEKGHPVTPSIKKAVCQALGTNDVEIVVSNRVKSAQNG